MARAFSHPAPHLPPHFSADWSKCQRTLAVKTCCYPLGKQRLRRTTANFRKFGNGGAGGIRTLDTVLPYTHFPGERLRPLGHRSAYRWKAEHLGKEPSWGKVAGRGAEPLCRDDAQLRQTAFGRRDRGHCTPDPECAAETVQRQPRRHRPAG